MDTTIAKHIEQTPGICGGKPRIAGTRIRVQDIYICHEVNGMSPDEIVDAFPHISLADVYAALAYFHDHRDRILRDVEMEERFVADFQRQNPSLIDLSPPHSA